MGFPVMTLNFLMQQDVDSCYRMGKGQPMIFWAVLMTFCTAFLSLAVEPEYHTFRQYVKTTSTDERLVQVVFPQDTVEVKPPLSLLL